MELKERAEKLLASTRDAYARGDGTILQHYAGQLLEVALELGEPQRIAQAYNYLGTAAIYQGNAQSAGDFFERAIQTYRSTGDTHGIISVLIGQGVVYGDFLLDYDESHRLFAEAIALAEQTKEQRLLAFAYANLGEIRRLVGDYASALDYAQRSVMLFGALKDETAVAAQLVNIAHYRALRVEFPQAIEALREARRALRGHPRFPEIASYFEIWFFIAIEIAHYEEAAELLGFLEWYRSEHNVPRLPSMMPWFAPRLERLERRLGYETMARLRRKGELLSLEEAHRVTERIHSKS